MEAVSTAINTMISDIATAALGLVTTNVPVIAPVIAAMILLAFGVRFAKRFAK